MESQEFKQPDYMSHPIIKKYINQLFHLSDDIHRETEGQQAEELVIIFRDILRVIFERIAIDGELVELDQILHMHFPDHYGETNSIPWLTEYPLSTSN